MLNKIDWRKTKNVAFVLLLVAAMVTLVGAPYTKEVLAVGGEPGSGTTVGIKTITFAGGTTPLAATTYYGGSGSGSTSTTLAGYDARYWHMADVFVTADISGTNTLTVTAQWSADNSNWVDAFYTSEGWILPLTHSTTITNASGVTNTTTSTHTISFAGSTGSRQSEDVTYRIALTADGSSIVSIPVKGNYLRLKAEVASAVNITPTIAIVLKNTGGH